MSSFPWLDRLDAIAPLFAEAAVRGAVVLLIALVVSHQMRRRTAAARHLVWVGAIVVRLALPLFALWGPPWEVGVPDVVGSVLPMPLASRRGAPRLPEPVHGAAGQCVPGEGQLLDRPVSVLVVLSAAEG